MPEISKDTLWKLSDLLSQLKGPLEKGEDLTNEGYSHVFRQIQEILDNHPEISPQNLKSAAGVVQLARNLNAIANNQPLPPPLQPSLPHEPQVVVFDDEEPFEPYQPPPQISPQDIKDTFDLIDQIKSLTQPPSPPTTPPPTTPPPTPPAPQPPPPPPPPPTATLPSTPTIQIPGRNLLSRIFPRLAGTGGPAGTVGTASTAGATGVTAGAGAGATTAVAGTGAAAAGISTGWWIAIIIIILLLIVAIIVLLTSTTTNTQVALYTPLETEELAAAENPYIAVEKTASPTSFENPSGNISYTYTITPKQGTLTNVSITDQVNIIQEEGTSTVDLAVPPPPQEISSAWTSPTFTLSLTPQMDDSIITNIITITFTSPDGNQQSTIASAAVLVGDPPLGCFVFNETTGPYSIGTSTINSLGWRTHQTEYSKVISSIAYLSRSATWRAYVCTGGPVNLTYSDSHNYGGWAPSATTHDIVFYPPSVQNSQTTAIYTFAHESGHIIYYHNTSLVMSLYRDSGAPQEGWLPTYPNPELMSEFEDIAESMGVYPVYQNYVFSSGTLNLETQYLYHYNFAHSIYQIEF